MAWLQELIAGPPALNRQALSKEFCRRIGWYKADGGLKDMMARVVMLAMHKDGLIELPPPKWCPGRRGPVAFRPDTEPLLFPPPTALDEVRSVQIRTVVRGDPGSMTTRRSPFVLPNCGASTSNRTRRIWRKMADGGRGVSVT